MDTAGRQHTHAGLMDELKKIRRVLGKLDETAPHEVLLVLDAGTGQNALSQLAHFRAAVGVTGLVITKLDGTAKGGIVIAIAKKPVCRFAILASAKRLTICKTSAPANSSMRCCQRPSSK